jgi:hypothetical protein
MLHHLDPNVTNYKHIISSMGPRATLKHNQHLPQWESGCLGEGRGGLFWPSPGWHCCPSIASLPRTVCHAADPVLQPGCPRPSAGGSQGVWQPSTITPTHPSIPSTPTLSSVAVKQLATCGSFKATALWLLALLTQIAT